MADENKSATDGIVAEIKTSVDNFTKKAGEIETVVNEVKTTVNETSQKLITLDTGIKSLNEWKVGKDKADEANQKAIDELLLKAKDIHLGPKLDKDSFKEALLAELQAKKENLTGYKKSRAPFALDLKVVGDIGAAQFTTSGTNTFAGPTMMPGVAGPAFRKTHVRDILGTTPVQTDSVAVLRSSVGEGGPTTVAVGGLKPQSDADWVKVIIPITKVAHYYTVPEEYLEDITWLANDITNIGIEELMRVEDNELVSNAAAGEFTGLVQNSTAYAAPAGLALGVEAANNYDVLVSAIVQLRNANRDANMILMDNDSWAQMVLAKDANDNYLFGAPNIAFPNVYGIPIVPLTVSTLADKFIVGDKNFATVAVRSGISVRFYDQHANNAIYNLVTIVIEERIALVVKRTDAFIYGDFSDARAALETA